MLRGPVATHSDHTFQSADMIYLTGSRFSSVCQPAEDKISAAVERSSLKICWCVGKTQVEPQVAFFFFFFSSGLLCKVGAHSTI